MTASTDDQTYNGWTNYATWGVALVLDNEQNTYSHVREEADRMWDEAEGDEIVTHEQIAVINLSNWLRDFTERLCGLEDDPGPSLMARQLLSAGLSDVDWHEIARVVYSERS